MDSIPAQGAVRGAEEVIDDPARIDRILRALARLRAEGRVLTREDVTVGHILAVGRSARDGAAMVRWEYDGALQPGSLRVEMAGLLSLFRFELEPKTHLDGRLVTAIPKRLVRARHRTEQRIAAPPNVVLRYRSRDGRSIVRELHDVSRHGLSFKASAARDHMPPGTLVEDAVVDWQGRLRVLLQLEVRHVSEDFGEGQQFAGASIVFDSEEDARHWQIEVGAHVDRRTRIGGTWTRDIWELFEKSGYFALSDKHPEDFEGLRAAFTETSRKLGRAHDLGAQIVWPSSRGLEAAISIIYLNHHSIFIYHLARRHGNPPPGATGRTILFDVYDRAFTWMQRSERAKWLVAWVQDVSEFSKKLHLDFVARHANGLIACVVPFHALEVPTQMENTSQRRLIAATPQPAEAEPTWTVRAATHAELAFIADTASQRYPPGFVDALDLAPPFERRWDAWDDTGLMRGRDIVVVEREGRVHAAGIIECAEDGVHVFGLLDVLRIIPLGPRNIEANAAILEHARRQFGRLGKRVFIYACEEDVPKGEWPDDAADLGLTHCAIMSIEQLLPRFAEHAWELMMSTSD